MFPAVGLELEAVGVAEDGHLELVGFWLEDAANAGDGDAGDGARDLRGGSGGEEKLIVFSTVQERRDLGAFVECGCEGVERQVGEV